MLRTAFILLTFVLFLKVNSIQFSMLITGGEQKCIGEYLSGDTLGK